MPVRGIPSPFSNPSSASTDLTTPTVTVKAGDTLWKIARRFGLDLQQLLEANPALPDPDRIKPGQVLALPERISPPASTARAGGVDVDDVFGGGPVSLTTVFEPDSALSTTNPALPALPAADITARQLAPSQRLPSVVMRAIDTEVFRHASAPHAAARTVRLGDAGDARVALDSKVAPGATTAERSALEADAATRRERAVFATTRGGLDVTLNPHNADKPLVAGGVGFSLDRPYLLSPGGNQGIQLATAMVRGSTDELPLSATKALALPPTSRFTLDGYATASPTLEGAAGRVAARADVAASVEVERGQGSLVKVTMTRRGGLEGAASSTSLASGDAGVSVQAAKEDSRTTQATYTLDLETPAGRRAYESLIAFRAGPADALIDDRAAGVTRGEVRQASVRAQTVAGQARAVVGDTTLEVGRTQTRRRERDLAGGERSQTSSSASAAASTTTRGVVLGLGGARRGTTDLTVPAGATGPVELPRSAQAALELPEGTSWRLTTDERIAGAARRSDASVVEESRDRALTIDVTRKAGSTVRIEATRNDNAATSLTQQVAATPTRAGIDVVGGRESARSNSFRATLDLAQPEHRAAYESLLRGDAAAAIDIARIQNTSSEETRRGQHATITATSPRSAPVTGTATLSWKREVTAEGPHGARVESGTLQAGASLTTTMGDATIGFTPGRTSSYELSLPAGAPADVVLPTDATKAQALPSGARFRLEGEGKLGASATVADLKAGASELGKVRVEVVRGDGDVVELRARMTTERRTDVDGTLAVGRADRPQVQLTGSQRRQRERGHDVSVSLDLAKPADRAAYDAALRGDLAPARQLTSEQTERATTTTIDDRSAQHEVGVALKNLTGVTVEGRVSREVFPANDLRVAFDDDRRAATEALRADGKSTEWQELKARGALGADLRKDVPLTSTTAGTPQSVGLGFSSGKSVSIRVFSTVADQRDQPLALPARAAEALALARGTEVEVTGEGNLSTTVKAAMGGPLATAPGLVLAGTVSAGASQTTTDRFSVTVRRGEGASATVSITDAAVREKDTEVGVRVGLTVDPTAVIGVGVTSSLPALAKKPLEGALGKVGEAINDKASIALSHRTSKRSTKEDGLELRFDDLTQPDAAAAYAEAVQGRPEAALALAERARAGEPTGVQMIRGIKLTSSSTERRTSLTAGGGTLFLREALRRDSTQIVRDADGTSTTQTSSYREKSRGLLGDRKEMLWEAVSVRTSDDPAGQRFYRMTFERSDPMTSRGDVARVQRMAEDLGATPARPIRADAKGGLASAVGAAMGKTRTELEVFVTPKGMDALRGTTKEQALLTYGKAVAMSEGAATVAPWANADDAPKARALLEQYERLRNEPRSEGDDPSERVRLDYWFSYRRNIWDDTGPYKRATAFAASVERLGHSSDPGEWNKAFADVGKGSGFHVADAVSAINSLAGADELLVHRLKMSGSRVDLEMVDEGLRERPANRALPSDTGINRSAF